MYNLYIEKKDSKTLLREVLDKEGIKGEVLYNEYGKPYIKDNPIYFSISNKDNISVIVTSEYRIGVDIESITYKSRVVSHAFLESEYTLDSKEFTTTWVLKEAYVKMIGEGISYGLKNVDTTKIKNKYIKYYEDYIIGVCIDK